ncbi:hypothetical protein M8Z33_07585 [Streptomyces sp. ZAF1911]|uniref:hypothetical protein n=1 Tax=Streptomyces sp. ZAF1911 TaxID=2944129 RepID=UPI00237A4463|nr:hypothetical protein [Streptomyces sp. ZAF1911]MDD9376536.1 hypothetical protein [Streptomyces sp. ZAF1911]
MNGLADLLDLPVTPAGGTFADADHFAYEGRSGCFKHPAERARIVSTLLPAAPRASTRRTPNPEEPTHGTGCPQCVRDLIARLDAEQETAGDDAPDDTAPKSEPTPEPANVYRRRAKKAAAPVNNNSANTAPTKKPGRRGRPRNAERDQDILRRIEAGEKPAAVATAVGCDRATVYNTINFFKEAQP